MGIKTTDQFTNGDVLYEESVENVRANLRRAWAASDLKFECPDGKEEVRVVPVVTGFLGQGEKTGAITTLGRGGSDLTATFIGMALGIDEVVVWKDVDGVMTTDPRVVPDAKPIPLLTVEEATELAYFGATVLHPQSMQPLLEKQRGVGGSIPGGCDDLRVRVKNSYNTGAPGSVICAGDRNMEETVLTSIVLKSGVNMLDIVSTRMLGQYGFLAKVFSIFEDLQVSPPLFQRRFSFIFVMLTCRDADLDRTRSPWTWWPRPRSVFPSPWTFQRSGPGTWMRRSCSSWRSLLMALPR